MRAPLIKIALLWSIGIVLHPFLKEYVLAVGALTVCMGVLILLPRRSTVFANGLCMCVIVFTSLVYTHQFWLFPQTHISFIQKYYTQKPVTVTGRIVSDVSLKKIHYSEKSQFTLLVKSYSSPWGEKALEGKLLVHVFRPTEYRYGDVIRLTGKLHRPYNFKSEGKFSYKDYLQRKGIYQILSVKKNAEIVLLKRDQGFVLRRLALRLRNHFKEVLTTYLSPTEAGIIQAMLLGERSQLPPRIRELFVLTGTVHILAISGLHIGVLSFCFMLLMRLVPIPRSWKIGGVFILLGVYVLLTGMRPSVVRAALMLMTVLMSLSMERQTQILNNLGLAAVLLLLINPFYLQDVGFQLSFGCVLAIIILKPLITELLPASRWNHKGLFQLWDMFSCSLAVWLGIAGILAYYFHLLTPVTVLANLCVIPLLSVIIVISLILLVSGFWMPYLSLCCALCLKFILNLLVAIVYVLEKLPWAHVVLIEAHFWQVGVYYGLLGIAMKILANKRFRSDNSPLRPIDK